MAKRIPLKSADLVKQCRAAATDAEMKTVVAEVTVTASEYEFTGLTTRTQYWFRVRSVGTGGEFGPWSDVATLVANL